MIVTTGGGLPIEKLEQQWKLLFVITLGQRDTDNNNRMITLAKLPFLLSEVMLRNRYWQNWLKLTKIWLKLIILSN
jgi:hypothetical protein